MVPATSSALATPPAGVSPIRIDAEPRVIQQFTSVFLVSRFGDLWRIYDCATSDGSDRRMPSAGSTLSHRLFLSLARKTEIRAYAFSPGETRDMDAQSLQRQLDGSRR
jgi:hypothetical protein